MQPAGQCPIAMTASAAPSLQLAISSEDSSFCDGRAGGRGVYAAGQGASEVRQNGPRTCLTAGRNRMSGTSRPEPTLFLFPDRVVRDAMPLGFAWMGRPYGKCRLTFIIASRLSPSKVLSATGV
jgi:hypothetical protein